MNTRHLLALACVLGMTALALADDATDHGSPVPRNWKPSTDVSSPHVPWMKPSVVGPIRVLVVQPWRNLREVVELDQRLEIVFDVLPVTSVGPNCDETRGMFPYEQEDFAAKLNEADVLILCGIPPQWLTDELWRAMLHRIEQGMGLVWTVAVREHPRLDQLLAPRSPAPEYVLRGAPFSLFRYIHPPSNFQCSVRGKGRVAVWLAPTFFRTGWSTMTPVTPWAGDESFYAVIARLVTWASSRPLPARVLLPGPNITTKAGSPFTVEVAIAATEAISSASLLWTVRDASDLWDFESETGNANTLGYPRQVGRSNMPVVHSQTISKDVVVGDNSMILEVPPLPDGNFVIDVRLIDGTQKAVDWDATAIFVVGAPRIRWIALPETGVPPDGVAHATVTIDRHDDAPEGVKLVWHAVDTYGRTLARGSAPWNGQAMQVIEFSLRHPLTKGMDLDVSLVRGESVISRRSVTGLITLRRDKPFRYGVYEPLLARMEDLAVDMLVTGYKGKIEERDLAQFDLDAYLWLNGPSLYNARDAQQIRRPCFNDPAFRTVYADYLASIGPMLKRQVPVGGLITDEWDYPWAHNAHFGTRRAGKPGPLHDLCNHEACIANFTAHLRAAFDDDLTRLNKAWGASFAKWEDVKMPRLTDVPTKLTPAATASRLRFADSTVASFFDYVNTQARQYDASLRLGLSGTRATDGINGYDYWQLAQRGARSFVHYGGPTVAQTLDFRHADVFVSRWEGYSIWNSSGADAVIWRAFIEGQDAFIQYAAYPSYGTHHIDHTIGAGTAVIGRAFREIDCGLGMLVRNAKRLRSSIAIHYSPDSFAVAAVGLVPGFHGTAMSRRVDQVHRLLADVGFDPPFLATAQVERDELLSRNIKVFVLVDSIAMSDLELRAIEKFQQAGGIVLATSPAGRFTQHGEPRLTLPEFQPFGIGDYAHAQQGGFGGELESLASNPTKEKVVRAQIADQLGQLGVNPTVAIRDQGELACRIVTHRDGEAAYHMIWPGPFLHDERNQRPRAEATVEVPGNGCLYDIRVRKELGVIRPMVRTIEEGDPILLAVLPYSVKGLHLESDRKPVRAGEPARLTARVVRDGTATLVDHVIEISVLGPDGQKRPAYHHVQLARQGTCEISIPLVSNDTPGVWHIKAQDVVSGATAEHRITVTGSIDE